MIDLRRLGILALVLGFVASFAFAQDDRIEPPKTPAEFWRAVQFEVNSGKYDAAAYYLNAFLAAKPTDDDLVAIEAKDGLSSFLRLRNVTRWSADAKVQAESKKNVEDAITRVSAALDKKLGDAARINRFIGNLRASPEERAYAIAELQRSSSRAVPLLVAALRGEVESTARANILSVIPQLPSDSVAPLLAAMDMKDAGLKYQLLSAMGERTDLSSLANRTEYNPLPSLDYLAASEKESPDVRRMARQLIVRIRPIAPSAIRAGKEELTDAAMRIHRHEAKFIQPDAVPIWTWEHEQLKVTSVPASRAEEYLGLRYARWALDLDHDHLPAQAAFLGIAVEKAYERAGIAGSLVQSQPQVHDLLATSGAATLVATLNQALADHKAAVALATIKALGDRAESRALMPTRMTAGPLQRALEYPDRRVQFAAAEAIVRMPECAFSGAQVKVIETLRQALANESEVAVAAKPRALLVWFNRAEATDVAKQFEAAGFEWTHVRTGKEAIRRVQTATDIDLIAIDASEPNPLLPDLLASLAADSRSSSIPVRLVFTPIAREAFQSTQNEARLHRSTYQTTTLREHEERRNIDALVRVQRLAEGLRNVQVLAGPIAPAMIRASYSQEDAGNALSAAERKQYAKRAIELFREIAVTRAAGYDLQLADRAIRQSLRSDDLAVPATAVVGRLPGRDAQFDLAGVVVDAKRSPELRMAAAENLVGHIQRFGATLTAAQTSNLEAVASATAEPVLRGRIADVVGALNIEKTTGQRLRAYHPAIAAPQAKPPEKKEEKPADPAKKEEEDKAE